MKTIKDEVVGKLRFRVVENQGKLIGLIIAGKQTTGHFNGESVDEIWAEMLKESGKANPAYFGFEGARNRFRHWFGDGFESPNYIAEERAYKLQAKAKLDQVLPLEKIATGKGFGEAALAAYRSTNLLYPVEKTRLQALFRGPNADSFVQAAARFALGETKTALAQMEALLRPHENAKWTVVTYLPFLWMPTQHMYLKPEVTKAFAARVGHPFAEVYESGLNLAVYESLLDLARTTEHELADMKPRDWIDVQSFIWVVGEYRENREEAKS